MILHGGLRATGFYNLSFVLEINLFSTLAPIVQETDYPSNAKG